MGEYANLMQQFGDRHSTCRMSFPGECLAQMPQAQTVNDIESLLPWKIILPY
jgi:hypothetical protein